MAEESSLSASLCAEAGLSAMSKSASSSWSPSLSSPESDASDAPSKVTSGFSAGESAVAGESAASGDTGSAWAGREADTSERSLSLAMPFATPIVLPSAVGERCPLAGLPSPEADIVTIALGVACCKTTVSAEIPATSRHGKTVVGSRVCQRLGNAKKTSQNELGRGINDACRIRDAPAMETRPRFDKSQLAVSTRRRGE